MPPFFVRLLLDRGADVALHASSERQTSFMDHGQNALNIAASCVIARRRAAIAPERGMPPSYVRAELDAPRSIVRFLIERGAKVNTPDADGLTPLMMAVLHGWPDVVDDLLAARAAVTTRDNEGRTAIDYADPQNTTIVKAIQKAGALPLSGRSGRTVCDAEIALDKLGYNIPIIDCIGGQQLSTVITKFQSDHQLRLTGELDSETRKVLKMR